MGETFLTVRKIAKITLKQVLKDFKAFVARVLALRVAEEIVGVGIRLLKSLFLGPGGATAEVLQGAVDFSRLPPGTFAQHGAVIPRPTLVFAGEREEEIILPTRALAQVARGEEPADLRPEVHQKLWKTLGRTSPSAVQVAFR